MYTHASDSCPVDLTGKVNLLFDSGEFPLLRASLKTYNRFQIEALRVLLDSISFCFVVRMAIVTSFVAVLGVLTGTAQESMKFGIDVASAGKPVSKGLPMTYASIWAGSWIQKSGWGGIESQLKSAKKNGLVPVVQWWYWGDDISPNVVENGIWDARQSVQKNKATWYRLSNELADVIVRVMGPDAALVVVEPEFNKNGIETYEPFDALLAEQVTIFHRKGDIKVGIGFGNWAPEYWSRFAGAVDKSDFVGTQLLQSSIRDAATYLKTVDTLITGAGYLQGRFHKPCLIIDLALSSYPQSEYEGYQAAVIKELFARLPELKKVGVHGLIWRQLADDPKFDTSNYHGVAERFWGLFHADGTPKAAFEQFAHGIQSEMSDRPAT
jgi:hypothetical protein